MHIEQPTYIVPGHTLPSPSKRPRRGPRTTDPHKAATPASMCTGGYVTICTIFHHAHIVSSPHCAAHTAQLHRLVVQHTQHNCIALLCSTHGAHTCTGANSVIDASAKEEAANRGGPQGGCPSSRGPDPVREHGVDPGSQEKRVEAVCLKLEALCHAARHDRSSRDGKGKLGTSMTTW